jgi:hypothetical protein
MLTRRNTALFGLITIAVSALTCPRADAQNFQNWLNNLNNGIQQQASSGLLSPNQAADLQNREAGIMRREQVDMAQNGGYLTPGQASSISNKLRNLNNRMRNDVRNNANNGIVPAAYPYGGGSMWNRLWGNNTPPPPYPNQWQNANYVGPNGYTNCGQYHRHHHHWNNGNHNGWYNHNGY